MKRTVSVWWLLVLLLVAWAPYLMGQMSVSGPLAWRDDGTSVFLSGPTRRVSIGAASTATAKSTVRHTSTGVDGDAAFINLRDTANGVSGNRLGISFSGFNAENRARAAIWAEVLGAGGFAHDLVFGTRSANDGTNLDAATDEKFRVTSAGHVDTAGSAPSVGGSCGTGPAIVGTNVAGKVTSGTGTPTSCTVSFTSNWTNAPACNVTNETTANLTRATSTVSNVILAGTMVAGDVLAYTCLGRR